jgi:hypothetical protein
LPKRSFATGQVPSINTIVADPDLNLTGVIDVRSSQLASALSAIMSMQGSSIVPSPGSTLPTPQERLNAALMTAANASNFDFAEYAAYADDVVPVESSPLRAVSLASLWEGAKTVAGIGGAAGAGVKLGIAAAVAAGVAGSPLLVLVGGTVGVVLVVGSAVAVEGIVRPKIKKWMSGSGSEPVPQPG